MVTALADVLECSKSVQYLNNFSFPFMTFFRDQILTKQSRLEGHSSVIDFEYQKFSPLRETMIGTAGWGGRTRYP